MPLTIENAGALVGGVPAFQGAQMAEASKDVRVKALRGFFVAGKPVAVGEFVSVPKLLALDLRSSGKAEFAEVAPAQEVKTAPPKSEPKAGSGKKE